MRDVHDFPVMPEKRQSERTAKAHLGRHRVVLLRSLASRPRHVALVNALRLAVYANALSVCRHADHNRTSA
jgi:hypothetical protein